MADSEEDDFDTPGNLRYGTTDKAGVLKGKPSGGVRFDPTTDSRISTPPSSQEAAADRQTTAGRKIPNMGGHRILGKKDILLVAAEHPSSPLPSEKRGLKPQGVAFVPGAQETKPISMVPNT